MKRSRVSFALLAFAIAPLSVQAQRTYVSAQHGSDSNPCSITLPCRTFGAAITAVTAGGEVVVLDSGGYGAVTITKAVTIEAPAGIYAGVYLASGDGVDVNVGSTDLVVLRGLTLNSVSSNYGIALKSGGTLRVERCVITNWFVGIYQTAGRLDVVDTSLAGNTDGISISGAVSASVTRSTMQGGSFGLVATTGAEVAAVDCVASNNSTGFLVGSAGTTTSLVLDHCLAANNTTWGMEAQAFVPWTATLSVTNSTSTGNGTGLGQSGGGGTEKVQTLGNDLVVGNGTNIAGTVTVIAGH